MTQKKAAAGQIPAIVELLQVDSTNNYALSRIREGLAYHGMGIFAHEQLAGKGQRGKKWLSLPDQNIYLSLIIGPNPLILTDLFVLSALVAVETRKFLAEKVPGNWFIKWPNDIYFQDRKAVGMLIENIINGQNWKWAVAGIGVNVNQDRFPEDLKRAVSLKMISGENYDCLVLATELAGRIFNALAALKSDVERSVRENLEEYNAHLFMKDEEINFEENEAVRTGRVLEVTREGQLVVQTEKRNYFDFGEIKWIV
ncbi:biotin--[acetyl-CoA-carboxylase] ligase [Niabella beijingensis]|uniref:biotin--[acetyl-CoA-carboxylase] ligase n=1 Tax=Niabella beijingensis TaxID=2872700 RepID=UPI001CBB4A35|nr:biotin--[acetyl-CoA-carboxylase] ligase [Niabella beijingensis]MBZ4189676.1 biotin--[acetyl-CoA-carboxylase] ligase [Niabella beijingensis]